MNQLLEIEALTNILESEKELLFRAFIAGRHSDQDKSVIDEFNKWFGRD